MEDKKVIWNAAGKDGLILGGISVAYLALNWAMSFLKAETFLVIALTNILNVVLWAVKFYACITFMKVALINFSNENPEADNAMVFRFGSLVALLSALVYSAAYLAYMQYLAPDMIEQVISSLRDNPMMDSNSLQALDSIMPKLPSITFFSNLIYCSLFGTVLSAILSRNIPSRNPFEN